MKKKTIQAISSSALLLALISLALAAFCLASMPKNPEDHSQAIAQLRQENQQLQEQMEQLNSRIDQLMTVANLKSWSLDVQAWADGTGADVSLRAEPTEYQEGVSAIFLVVHENRQVASIPCHWDGEAFTATASLDGADGYRYYCQLSSSGGTQQLALANPEVPEPENAVYLKTALSAYCNLVVSGWSQKDQVLTLTNAYAQAQLPQLTPGGAVKIDSAELVLRLGGNDASRIPIQLTPSEIAGSYELIIHNIQLPMPELRDLDNLELYLLITLSDGRKLQAFGISWHMEGKNLTAAVG